MTRRDQASQAPSDAGTYAVGPPGRLACCMPVKDPGRAFPLTLASFADSTALPYLIVIDDGSQTPVQVDFTAYGLDGVVVRLERNLGVAAALNVGLRLAQADGFDFVARMDADDILYPRRFERQLAFLAEHPGCLCVLSAADLIDETGRIIGRRAAPDAATLRRRMAMNNVLIHPTALFRADYIRRVGFYSEAYPWCEDYDYFARGLGQGCLETFDDAVIQYRVSTASASFAKSRQQVWHRLRVQWDRRADLGPWVYTGMLRSCVLLLLHLIVPPLRLQRIKLAWQRMWGRRGAVQTG